MNNLLSNLPTSLSEELTDILAQNKYIRIERIVSTGHTTPAESWYDQHQTEWVLLLKGEAKLLFEGDPEPTHLHLGDSITIPAHRKHRVAWTTPNEPTVWLAIFFPTD